MVNILISGALGKMGAKVYAETLKNENVKAVCGVDIKEDFSVKDFPVYGNFDGVKEKVDVIIDFSSPLNLDALLSFAIKNKVNAVLCTTGYTDKDTEKIKKASEKIAIFRSANMSLGVNVLIDLVKSAAKSLYGFDIEIVETHHNKKKDAPSGTAIMIADGIKEVLKEKKSVYGRSGLCLRDKNEIGISAVRGGNIVGIHDVTFFGENESVTISHSAYDRSVFAEGAVKAAEFLCKKNKGSFDMNDMLKND